MKYLLISFKSRNSLFAFAKNLRLNGIAVEITNTPHSISISCGLSAKLNITHLNYIINLVSHTNFDNLVGIFIVTRTGLKDQITKIY